MGKQSDKTNVAPAINVSGDRPDAKGGVTNGISANINSVESIPDTDTLVVKFDLGNADKKSEIRTSSFEVKVDDLKSVDCPAPFTRLNKSFKENSVLPVDPSAPELAYSSQQFAQCFTYSKAKLNKAVILRDGKELASLPLN
ncbi:hypothetical protein KRX54_02065 [Actinomycetaceae bacterium TAE3-ERU4]|nr:hypothetical protein [Actinomycetaceae bacterium TAE3-ERU4]